MFKDSILFEEGFLGTQASLYMDLTTIYFSFLPFLLALSIKAAINKKIKLHLQSQVVIFVVTLLVIIVFEVGVRVEGGFIHFEEKSLIPFSALFAFLTIHINIAIISVLAWVYLLFATLKVYKKKEFTHKQRLSHKKMGKYVFAALSLTSLMGVMMYFALFVYIK